MRRRCPPRARALVEKRPEGEFNCLVGVEIQRRAGYEDLTDVPATVARLVPDDSFTMPHLLAEPPIIIVGCPRSGTCLSARLIGSAANLWLITEHTNKRKNRPEAQMGHSG
jgi:hypothetical protein